MWPCIVTNFFEIKTNRCTNFTNSFFMKLYMFRTVRLSIIRSIFTVHSAMLYVIQVCRHISSRTIPSWSCSKAVYKPVWYIPLLSVQWINSWWWAVELSGTCKSFMTKWICEISASSWFYYKGICYDARSHEHKSHWHSSVFLSAQYTGWEQSALNRCTVQPFTESDDTRCCVNTICPPEDGHVNARNMSRIVV